MEPVELVVVEAPSLRYDEIDLSHVQSLETFAQMAHHSLVYDQN